MFAFLLECSCQDYQVWVMVDESMADDGGGTLDLRAVEAEIRGIKGIGEKRAEEIMLIFEKHLGILDEEGQ